LRRKLAKSGLVLCLLLFAIKLSGCALFQRDYTGVGIEHCPAMSYEAIAEYEQYAPEMDLFRVWMGQMIVYCEKQATRLE
jgi:hypothetical protein